MRQTGTTPSVGTSLVSTCRYTPRIPPMAHSLRQAHRPPETPPHPGTLTAPDHERPRAYGSRKSCSGRLPRHSARTLGVELAPDQVRTVITAVAQGSASSFTDGMGAVDLGCP